MICYPVIYTRTFNCDYFSKFHILPDFVDADWVLQYIRSATTDMNPSNNQIKRIVITDTEVCVFGIIAYAKDIIDSKLEIYFRDDKGRAIYGFYGFAVKINENSTVIPMFSTNDIYNMYKSYIVPVWNDTVQHTQIPLSVSLCEKDFYNDLNIESEYFWNNTTNIFSSEKNLYELLLYKAMKGDIISYCSCINDYKALKKSPFNYVVTSHNNLIRLKNEIVIQDKSSVGETQNIYDNCSKQPTEQNETSYTKNIPSYSHANLNSEFDGLKKNKHMGEDSFHDKELEKEDFPEKELTFELANILKKYFKSVGLVTIAVAAAVAVIASIYKSTNQKKEDE